MSVKSGHRILIKLYEESEYGFHVRAPGAMQHRLRIPNRDTQRCYPCAGYLFHRGKKETPKLQLDWYTYYHSKAAKA